MTESRRYSALKNRCTKIMMATTQTGGQDHDIDSALLTSSETGQGSFPAKQVTKVAEKTMDNSQEEEEDFLSHVPLDVTELDLNHERLTSLRSLRLERFTRLGSLCLRQNLIPALDKEVDFSALTNLTELDVYDNRIDELSITTLAPLHQLVSLDLSFNNLRQLPASTLQGNPCLVKLYISCNQLSDADPALGKTCPLLEVLELGGNRLRRLPSGMSFPNLKELWLGKNKISKLEGLEGLPNLRILSVQSNHLTVMEGLDSCLNLEELYLSHNSIGRIQGIDSCTKLRVLDISSNMIQDVEGLESCCLLEEFWANDNQISSLAQIEGQLANKVHLTTVYFERNQGSLCDHPMYRLKLKTVLPQITQIDATLCR